MLICCQATHVLALLLPSLKLHQLEKDLPLVKPFEGAAVLQSRP